MWQKKGKIWALCLNSLALPQSCHYLELEPGNNAGLDTNRKGVCHSLTKGIHIMRKIIMAAAIATSALGLAACSGETATETEEAADAMAADAEANADAAVEGAAEATDAAAEATEAAADATVAAAEGAADAAEATADEAMKAAE
jgi:hypothetical protein